MNAPNQNWDFRDLVRARTVLSFLCCFTTLAVLSMAEQGRAQAAPRAKMVAHTQVRVDGTQVFLSDLFSRKTSNRGLLKKLDGTVVGLAPQPGKSKSLAGAEVQRRLWGLGITASEYEVNIPEEILITRNSQTLSIEDVKRVLADQFLSTLDWKDVRLEKLDLAEDVELPVGDLSLTFECSPHTDLARPFFLNVNAFVDGEVVKRLFLRVVLDIQHDVGIALRDLKPGQPILAGDIRWEKRRLLSTVHKPVESAEFLEGKHVRTTIGAGRVLTQNLFLAVPVVRRGDPVTLVFENERLRVTTQGKSLASGFRGDRIRVVNPDSGKELLAEIVDEDTAKIVF